MKATLEYRFLVVGGGSAGCLLAAILARHQSGRVGLIEAGPASTDARTVVPNFYPKLFQSKLSWNYSTVPQPGLGGRCIAWPRGKLLGGSGAINALIFLQAAPGDFHRWGWKLPPVATDFVRESWNDVAPLAPTPSPNPWSLAFLEAAQLYGLRLRESWQASESNSCGLYSLMHRHGRRAHTGQLLFHHDTDSAAPQRPAYPNLTVHSELQADTILFDGERASGVMTHDHAGDRIALHATEKIILSAGTIGTPELLIRSGIGPTEQLQNLGIRPRVDLPAVGSNLQDHLVYPVIYQSNCSTGLDRRHSLAARQRYRKEGIGALASNIAEAGAIVALSSAHYNNASSPEVPTLAEKEVGAIQIHFTPTHYLKYPISPTANDHFSIAVTDLHPRSSGTIRYERGPDGAVKSCIDPQYFADSADLQRMIDAVEIAREIASQMPLRDLTRVEAFPGVRRDSAKSVAKSLRAFAQSIYHPVGTCRMQSHKAMSDRDTVVNTKGEVHGTIGLSVADASILPDLPSGNTNAVALSIAHRSAMIQMGVESRF